MRQLAVGLVAKVLALACAGAASAASAQSAALVVTCIDAGTLQPIAGAQVTVEGPALASAISRRTDSVGASRAEGLPDGEVSVTCAEARHQPFMRKDVRLRAGRTSRVNITLLPREWSSDDAAGDGR